MSINKFEIQLVKSDTKRERRRGGTIRAEFLEITYEKIVWKRENSVEDEVFDVKSRKIRRLADPEVDSDAVNKLHLDHRFQTIRYGRYGQSYKWKSFTL
jgi:hypothetical protein